MSTTTLNEEKPKDRRSYADQVYNFIRDQILSGELQQGDKIVEDKIAQEFGVSRTPIREALTRLQTLGLVHLQPRSYAEVTTIKPQQADDIAQLRLTLEQMVFRILCKNAAGSTTEKLSLIAKSAETAIRHKDKAAYFKADSLFHLSAAQLCGNKELYSVYRNFDGRVQLLRIAQHCTIDRLEIYMNQHYDIIRLIKEKRSSALDELLAIHIVHDLVRSSY